MCFCNYSRCESRTGKGRTRSHSKFHKWCPKKGGGIYGIAKIHMNSGPGQGGEPRGGQETLGGSTEGQVSSHHPPWHLACSPACPFTSLPDQYIFYHMMHPASPHSEINAALGILPITSQLRAKALLEMVLDLRRNVSVLHAEVSTLSLKSGLRSFSGDSFESPSSLALSSAIRNLKSVGRQLIEAETRLMDNLGEHTGEYLLRTLDEHFSVPRDALTWGEEEVVDEDGYGMQEMGAEHHYQQQHRGGYGEDESTAPSAPPPLWALQDELEARKRSLGRKLAELMISGGGGSSSNNSKSPKHSSSSHTISPSTTHARREESASAGRVEQMAKAERERARSRSPSKTMLSSLSTFHPPPSQQAQHLASPARRDPSPDRSSPPHASKPPINSLSKKVASHSPTLPSLWVCSLCQFANPGTKATCTLCCNENPATLSASGGSNFSGVVGGGRGGGAGLSSGVGGVLRRSGVLDALKRTPTFSDTGLDLLDSLQQKQQQSSGGRGYERIAAPSPRQHQSYTPNASKEVASSLLQSLDHHGFYSSVPPRPVYSPTPLPSSRIVSASPTSAPNPLQWQQQTSLSPPPQQQQQQQQQAQPQASSALKAFLVSTSPLSAPLQRGNSGAVLSPASPAPPLYQPFTPPVSPQQLSQPSAPAPFTTPTSVASTGPPPRKPPPKVISADRIQKQEQQPQPQQDQQQQQQPPPIQQEAQQQQQQQPPPPPQQQEQKQPQTQSQSQLPVLAQDDHHHIPAVDVSNIPHLAASKPPPRSNSNKPPPRNSVSASPLLMSPKAQGQEPALSPQQSQIPSQPSGTFPLPSQPPPGRPPPRVVEGDAPALVSTGSFRKPPPRVKPSESDAPAAGAGAGAGSSRMLSSPPAASPPTVTFSDTVASSSATPPDPSTGGPSRRPPPKRSSTPSNDGTPSGGSVSDGNLLKRPPPPNKRSQSVGVIQNVEQPSAGGVTRNPPPPR